MLSKPRPLYLVSVLLFIIDPVRSTISSTRGIESFLASSLLFSFSYHSHHESTATTANQPQQGTTRRTVSGMSTARNSSSFDANRFALHRNALNEVTIRINASVQLLSTSHVHLALNFWKRDVWRQQNLQCRCQRNSRIQRVWQTRY